MAQNVSQIVVLKNKQFNNEDVLLKADSLLRDRKNSNEIIVLLEALLSEDERDVIAAVDCLGRVFTGYLNNGDILEIGASTPEPVSDFDSERQYKVWLYEQYNETKQQFLGLLTHTTKAVQLSAAEALLSILISEKGKINIRSSVQSAFIKQLLSHLLSTEHSMKNVIRTFSDTTVDLSFKLRILEHLHLTLKKKKKQEVNEVYLLNVYEFLKVSWIPKKLSEGNSGGVKKLKFYYTESWVEYLRFQIPMSIFKRVLVDLHEKVLPNMKNPLVLTDFLTDSYNFGGAVSLLSLNGLFFLIQKYNLEYPNFFEKLFTLLTEEIFHVKYRPQFFYLMDLFLSSIHVPAYVIGAFVKKLARLSLSAPPDALLIVLPFLRNLLVRHPSLKVLVHRSDVNEVSSDPYLPEETCMSKCRAMESSLWEVKTLQFHWHPSVSKEACFINKSLPSMETDLADVLDTDFSELYNQEMKTELTNVPLSYDVPKGLFNRTEDEMASWWTV